MNKMGTQKPFRFSNKIVKALIFVLVTTITVSSVPIGKAVGVRGSPSDVQREEVSLPQFLTAGSGDYLPLVNRQLDISGDLPSTSGDLPIPRIVRTKYEEEQHHHLHDDYILAIEQIEQGNYSQALGNIEHCLSEYEFLSEDEKDKSLLAYLWFLTGYLNGELGNYENTLTALDMFLELDADTDDAYTLTMQAYELKLQAYEGLSRYKEMSINLGHLIDHTYLKEDESYTFNLWVVKCKLHQALGEYEEFFEAAEKVLEMDKSYSEVYLLTAQSYADLGKYEDMRKALEKYLVYEPNNEYIINLLKELEQEKQTYSIPVEEASPEPVIKESEQEQSYITPVEEGDHESYVFQEPTAGDVFYLGLMELVEENFKEAEGYFNRAIALDADYEGLHYHRGVCRISLEDYVGASEDFLISTKQNYMVQQSHYNRGVSLIMADEYELGLEAIAIAASMDEDETIKDRANNFLNQAEEAEREAHIINLLSMAQISADLNDLEDMCFYLEEYLLMEPEDTGIQTVLAHARFANNEYDKAIEIYDALLKLDTNIELEYYYGLAAMQLLDFKTAEEMFSSVISHTGNASPIYSSVYYYRGVCRMSLGDYANAVSDFSGSIRENDMVQGSLFNKGICRLMLDDQRGLEDVRAAASRDDDKEIKEQAAQLIYEIELEYTETENKEGGLKD